MIQDEAENTGIAIATPRLSNEVMEHYGRLNIPKSWCDGYVPFGLWFETYRSPIIMIHDEAENTGIAIATSRLSNEVMEHYGRLNIPKSWCDGYIRPLHIIERSIIVVSLRLFCDRGISFLVETSRVVFSSFITISQMSSS